MKKLNLTPEAMRARQAQQRETSRRPNTTCDLCKTPIYRRPSTLALNTSKFCSHPCANKANGSDQMRTPQAIQKRAQKMMGPENPAWKGGAMLRHRKGNYVQVRYVRCPPDLSAMARTDGYVMEHRLVMARWCGRLLTRTECVHHVNHKPLENERANLELWPDNRSHKLAEHGRFVEGAVNLWCPKV